MKVEVDQRFYYHEKADYIVIVRRVLEVGTVICDKVCRKGEDPQRFWIPKDHFMRLFCPVPD